jgi:general secretion pathway protein B
MSLILEALKKSERERRLGESPSIGSPIMAVRRRRNLLPWLVGLIALGLVALWWVRREHAPDTTPAPATATQAPAPAATAAKPATAPATPDATTFDGQLANPDTRAEIAQSSAATRLPRSKAPAGATTDLREKVESGELVVAHPQSMKPGEPVTVKETEAVAASAAAMPPPPANPASAAAPAPSKPGDTTNPPAAGPTARSGASAPTPAPTSASAVAVPPPPPAASDNSAAGDSIKLMWELPYATRRELPEIHLTMHVFASDPAQRFVIINDARHVQGDDVEGLKLVEIRSDGVVFEREGVRFLYPRGGR